jgi:hypothetical protein
MKLHIARRIRAFSTLLVTVHIRPANHLASSGSLRLPPVQAAWLSWAHRCSSTPRKELVRVPKRKRTRQTSPRHRPVLGRSVASNPPPPNCRARYAVVTARARVSSMYIATQTIHLTLHGLQCPLFLCKGAFRHGTSSQITL